MNKQAKKQIEEATFLKFHSGYFGEEVDNIEQIVQCSFTGEELFDYIKAFALSSKGVEAEPKQELISILTKEDHDKGYYSVCCQSCGWLGSSAKLDGGGQIADTGGYGDCYCPSCGQIDPDEAETDFYYIVQDPKNSIYKKQISELQSKLMTERKRNDKLNFKQ